MRARQLGRPPAKERKPYDLDAIIDVAVRVFLEKGYDGSTLDDVARAAGITKSSIYYHVASKEELLARGVDRALTALFELLDQPRAREGTALDRLKYILRETVRLAVTKQPEVALLLRVRGNTATEVNVLERRREFDHQMARLVAEAQRRRELRPGIDAGLTTRLLFGMINSISEWYRPDGKLAADDIAEAIFKLAFQGLAQS